MLFSLEALPAAEGDCLLLHWGTVAKPKLAIIDGGPGRTYEDTLRPRLHEIVAARDVASLTIDLAMVSHLDSDHIIGIKKLFRQLRKELEDQLPAADRVLRVKRLWHNIFNDIVGDKTDAYYKTLSASLVAANGGSATPELQTKVASAMQSRYQQLPKEEAEEEGAWIAAILAAHGDGRQLRIDFDYLSKKDNLSLNAPFEDAQGRPRLVQADAAKSDATISDLKLTVLGPRKAEIDALQVEFDQWLQTSDNAEASLLAAYADKSAKNLSSIVCIAELGGKRILLTGDARGDKILEALDAAGLLPLHVDVLKAPHHGSDNNVDKDFFEQITADAYVFSGDGKHGNPERTTLEWLTEARKKKAKYTIHLTYPVSDIDTKRRADSLQKKKPWSAAKDSLRAFFEDRASAGYAFTVNDAEPVLIELGDEAIEW